MPFDIMAKGAAISCPRCQVPFMPKRKDQKYCGKPCAKAATRNAARGSRSVENAQRNMRHYERAAWLSYDLNRMSAVKQRAMLLAILEAASGADAELRNFLFDPALIGADRASAIGKLYPDTKCPGSLNIAKMVNDFCFEEWGCGVRAAILDEGKPAGRIFREEDQAVEKVPPHIYERTTCVPARVLPLVGLAKRSYDWRIVARAMGDRGWRKHFAPEELDRLL